MISSKCIPENNIKVAAWKTLWGHYWVAPMLSMHVMTWDIASISDISSPNVISMRNISHIFIRTNISWWMERLHVGPNFLSKVVYSILHLSWHSVCAHSDWMHVAIRVLFSEIFVCLVLTAYVPCHGFFISNFQLCLWKQVKTLTNQGRIEELLWQGVAAVPCF